MSHSEPPQHVAAPRRFAWRRLFQFRLRTILILTTIIAVWLGWWSYKARQQREAVAALEEVGGTVVYNFDLPWTSGMKDPPKWPHWLLNHVGVDYFARVQQIILVGRKGADAGLEHLKGLTALKSLCLSYTQVTDAGLEHLKGLTALRSLDLDNTQVSDAGLEHLKDLTALQGLDLDNTQVSDAGLEHLKGLTALKWLWLKNTQVTDAGVARLLKALPNCKIYR